MSTSPATPAPVEWQRPSYLPETVKSAADADSYMRDLVARDAAEVSRRLTLPQKPEDLTLDLPKDFKAPEGIEFVPNENDPLLPTAKAFALKHGLSKAGWSELLALHASGQIGTQQLIQNAKAAEVQKLGPAGTQRVTAVNTFVAAVPGVTADEAKAFAAFTYTAAQVQVVEKIMAHMRNQGVTNFSQAHREHPTPPTISDAEWDKMSYTQKKEHAAKYSNAAAA